MNELQQTIYNELIDEILKDVPESEQEELKEAYKQYLVTFYSREVDPKIGFEKTKTTFVDIEKMKWNDKTLVEKQMLLFKDEALNRLGHLSNIALGNAKAKISNNLDGITKEEANAYIEEMKELVNKVRPFNKVLASDYLSEGILDFEYSIGLTDNTSLRIGRMR